MVENIGVVSVVGLLSIHLKRKQLVLMVNVIIVGKRLVVLIVINGLCIKIGTFKD